MKSPRVLIALSVLLLTVVAVPLIWDRVHTFYPTPETESAFLKNYTPTKVLDRFQEEGGSYLGGRTAAVELHLTTGRELFEADFVYLMTGQPL